MKTVKIKQNTFPLIWLWVIIHVFFAIGLWLYYLIKPCSDGFVIGSCAFGTNYVNLSLLESVIVYLIIATVYKFWKVRHGKPPRMREFIFIGVFSSLWVIGPLISTNTVIGFLSYPFLMLNFIIIGGSWRDLYLLFPH